MQVTWNKEERTRDQVVLSHGTVAFASNGDGVTFKPRPLSHLPQSLCHEVTLVEGGVSLCAGFDVSQVVQVCFNAHGRLLQVIEDIYKSNRSEQSAPLGRSGRSRLATVLRRPRLAGCWRRSGVTPMFEMCGRKPCFLRPCFDPHAHTTYFSHLSVAVYMESSWFAVCLPWPQYRRQPFPTLRSKHFFIFTAT